MAENICPACQAHNTTDAFCLNCKFPFQGTEDQKSMHIGKYISGKAAADASNKAIQKSRNILFFLAGLNVLYIILNLSNPKYDLITIFINLILAAAYLLFGILIKRSPVVFTVIPLVMITVITLLNSLLDPASIMQGFITKLFVILSLAYSVYLNYQAKSYE